MARSLTYENALNRSGVQWYYHEEILLEDINFDRGLRNQARILMPLDDELVEKYKERKAAGDEFPPVVLWRPGPRSKYVPVDGNNRLAAYQKVHKVKGTDAYVIVTEDEKVVDFMSWTFNNEVNGKMLSPDENMQHAVTLCRKYNYSVADVCKAIKTIKPWQLQQKLRVLEVREAADRNNVRVGADMTDDKLDKLHGLSVAGEEILCETLKTVSKAAAPVKEVQELVKEVREARTGQQKLKVLEDYKLRPEVKARQAETRGGEVKKPRPTPRDTLARLTRELLHLMEKYPEDEALMPLGVSDLRQMQRAWNAIIGRGRKLLKLSHMEEGGAA